MDAHKQISEDVEAQLLKKVRAKEQEIEKALQEARSNAVRNIELAHKEAEETLQKTKNTAHKEADYYKETRKKTIVAAADKILSEARVQTDKLHQQAQKNFDHALELILSRVLPKVREKSDVLTEASS